MCTWVTHWDCRVAWVDGSRESLVPGYPYPPHHNAVPDKQAGWSCFSLGANYIPRIPCAPTHALLGEKRKKKMRIGSWGTETDPKTVASLRATGMTRHRLQCLHLTLSTGLGQNKEQQMQETKSVKARRLLSPQDRS